ncbi:MAG: formyltetrahydrofolate deformylase [Sphingomonadaceae bacterium]|nr:formyltetrahydrofolate deformylase [Sphingomonadaceae bacterium]
MAPQFVLTVSCPDRKGIVAAVASFLAGADCNILDSAQYDSPLTGRFFMRVTFASEGAAGLETLQRNFQPIGDGFAMDWAIFDSASKPRVLLMVSKFGHCLNDLLYRLSIGALPIEVPAIVSNHPDMAPLAAAAGIPYIHIPVPKDGKEAAEAELKRVFESENCDFIVLARYMQVLSDAFCAEYSGRIINIHHSFLPSFKGAKPYHQAHARGVKMIGATAHFVTADLDEGPIIEQEAARVDHAMPPDALVAAGRDIESIVLARAVKWHAEHRVLAYGNRTVVFR